MMHYGNEKNFIEKWRVRMVDENEVRKFGECECCGNAITDEQEEYYVAEDGRVFCCIECVLESFGIEKIEV